MMDPRFGLAMALFAAAGVRTDEPDALRFIDDFHAFDDGLPRQRHPWTREAVDHIATPVALTKRQQRRLRGKAAHARKDENQ